MIIGAHVSTAGGLNAAIENGKKIAAEALQIFPSAPLRWQIRGWSDEDCAKFKTAWPKNFSEVVFHGIYLINLAGESRENLARSKTALIETLKLAAKLGIVGVIFHPGAYVNGELARKRQISDAIREVLAETPEQTKLIYENSAGSTIGSKIEELAWLLDVSGNENRVGVCLDTCHAFAAGYDIGSKNGYETYIDEVAKLIGLDKVFCWHFNDSKFPLGSKRDRHENIGQGYLGSDPFAWILNDERWLKHAAYLEVPGFDNQGPDAKNIEALKNLRLQTE